MLAQAACKKDLIQQATLSTSLSSTTTLKSNSPVAIGSIITIVGNVTSDGGTPVVERGICYTSFQSNDDKSHSEPTVNNSKLKHDAAGAGAFTMNINPGNASATYVVRAYAITKAGVAYGKAITFKTAAIEVKEVIKKIVTKQPTVTIVERSPKFQGGLSFNVNAAQDMSSWPLKSMTVEVHEIEKGKRNAGTLFLMVFKEHLNNAEINPNNEFHLTKRS